MDKRQLLMQELGNSMHIIKRSFMEQMLRASKKHNITPSQWSVINLLDNQDSLLIKELAARLKVSSSATTQLVDELASKGYLLRSPSKTDKRASVIKLTAKCKKHLEQIKNTHKENAATLFAVLNQNELAEFVRLHKKITDNLVK